VHALPGQVADILDLIEQQNRLAQRVSALAAEERRDEGG